MLLDKSEVRQAVTAAVDHLEEAGAESALAALRLLREEIDHRIVDEAVGDALPGGNLAVAREPL
jgi:hypothetical protein